MDLSWETRHKTYIICKGLCGSKILLYTTRLVGWIEHGRPQPLAQPAGIVGRTQHSMHLTLVICTVGMWVRLAFHYLCTWTDFFVGPSNHISINTIHTYLPYNRSRPSGCVTEWLYKIVWLYNWMPSSRMLSNLMLIFMNVYIAESLVREYIPSSYKKSIQYLLKWIFSLFSYYIFQLFKCFVTLYSQ